MTTSTMRRRCGDDAQWGCCTGVIVHACATDVERDLLSPQQLQCDAAPIHMRAARIATSVGGQFCFFQQQNRSQRTAHPFIKGAASSITQQIHTIIWWKDIKTEQHANLVENVGNPELNITGASTGMDLVLFYIRTPSLSPR